MTTSIAPIGKQQITELISGLHSGRLSEIEIEKFNRYVFISAKVWGGSVDGKLVCLWGLIPPTMLSEQAYLWLHVTEAAREHQFILVRRSQIELRKMLEEYPRIVGHCLAEASDSIRWLRWLGATFGEPDGVLVPFVIRAKEAQGG